MPLLPTHTKSPDSKIRFKGLSSWVRDLFRQQAQLSHTTESPGRNAMEEDDDRRQDYATSAVPYPESYIARQLQEYSHRKSDTLLTPEKSDGRAERLRPRTRCERFRNVSRKTSARPHRPASVCIQTHGSASKPSPQKPLPCKAKPSPNLAIRKRNAWKVETGSRVPGHNSPEGSAWRAATSSRGRSRSPSLRPLPSTPLTQETLGAHTRSCGTIRWAIIDRVPEHTGEEPRLPKASIPEGYQAWANHAPSISLNAETAGEFLHHEANKCVSSDPELAIGHVAKDALNASQRPPLRNITSLEGIAADEAAANREFAGEW